MTSIIIPVYNSADLLRQCLESLTHQSVPRDSYEIVVVDDGSSDGSADVGRSFGVEVVVQEQAGPAEARNAGVHASRGSLLLFTDADCVPDTDWVCQMTAPFADETVSGARGRYKTRQRGLVARFAQVEYEEKYEKLKHGDGVDFIDTSSAAYRRHVFLEAGGFRKSFTVASGEDTDLSFRLAAAGHRLVFCPDAVVYHTHPARLSTYLRRKFKTAHWRPSLYRQHPGKVVRDSHTPQMFKLQILSLYAAGLALCLLPVWGGAWLGLAAAAAVFVAASLPFLLFCMRRDTSLTIAAALFVFLRTLVFCVGLVSGMARLLLPGDGAPQGESTC